MKELGIEPPNLEQKPEDLDLDWFKWLLDYWGKARKGISTLSKWECPECGLKARIGIKGDPKIVHDPCAEKLGRKVFFIRADGMAHQMGPDTEYRMPHSKIRQSVSLKVN